MGRALHCSGPLKQQPTGYNLILVNRFLVDFRQRRYCFPTVQTLWIALAGALGAVTRYRIAAAVGVRSFPWATLGINVVGCFALAMLLSGPAASRRPMSVNITLSIGFLGAFTTFSTFGYETFTMLRTDRPGTALMYVLASVMGGVLAASAGYAFATSRALG